MVRPVTFGCIVGAWKRWGGPTTVAVGTTLRYPLRDQSGRLCGGKRNWADGEQSFNLDNQTWFSVTARNVHTASFSIFSTKIWVPEHWVPVTDKLPHLGYMQCSINLFWSYICYHTFSSPLNLYLQLLYMFHKCMYANNDIHSRRKRLFFYSRDKRLFMETWRAL